MSIIRSGQAKEFLLVSAILILLIAIFFGRNFGSDKTMVPLDIRAEYDLLETNDVQAKNYLLSDIVFQFYPNLQFQFEQFSQHRFPFWNPYQLGGVPFFADSQTSVFEITKLLAFLFGLSVSNFFLFSGILTLYLLGIFSYYFFKSLNINWLTAIFGAIALMFCGPVIVWLNYPLTSTFIYLPLILLLINLAVLQRRSQAWPWLSVAIAAQFFAGQPQMSLIIFILAGGYAFFLLLHTRQIKSAIWVRIALFGLLGVLLAAVQLGPSYDLLKQSESWQTGRGQLARQNIFKIAQSELQHPVQSVHDFYTRSLVFGITALYPDYYGTPQERNYRSPAGNWYNNYSEMSNYAGILVVFLALMTFFWLHERRMQFWLAGAILSFGLFAHLPFFNLFSYLPLINKINSGRFRYIFVFCLIVLAVLAVQKLLAQIKIKKIKIGVGILLAAIIFGDLYFQFNDYHHSVKLSDYAAVNPTTTFLRENLNHQRYAAVGLVEQGFATFNIPNSSTALRLRDIRGYNQLLGKDFLSLAGTFGTRRGSWILQDAIFRKKYFDALAVKYYLCQAEGCLNDQSEAVAEKVFGDKQVGIFANPDSGQRAQLISDVIYVEDQSAALNYFKASDFDPRSQAIVFADQHFSWSPATTTGEINIIQDDPGNILLNAQIAEPTLLVLSESYDAGWQARVNGDKTKIFQTNVNFMSVELPAGSSAVSFLYRPPHFFSYLAISLLSLLAILISFWRLKKKTV